MPRWLPLAAVAALASCDEGPADPFAVPVVITPATTAEAPIEIPVARYTAPPRFVTVTIENTGSVPIFVTPAYPLAQTVSNSGALGDDVVETFVTASLNVFTSVAPHQKKPLQLTLDDRFWRWRTGEYVVRLPMDVRYLWAGQGPDDADPIGEDIVPEPVATAVDVFVKFSIDCDLDDDGVDDRACGGRDCDDSRPDVKPGVEETCDGVDEDCDGAKDEGALDRRAWYRDADLDGYGDPDDEVLSCTKPAGYLPTDGDCDDTTNRVSPSAIESCSNGVDDDCDGKTDMADQDC